MDVGEEKGEKEYERSECVADLLEFTLLIFILFILSQHIVCSRKCNVGDRIENKYTNEVNFLKVHHSL